MFEMNERDFEALVGEALDEIPEPFASHLSNVEVVVQDEPTSEDLAGANVAAGGTLFGLYQGVPQTERGAGYTFVLPDKITIYRGPILRDCNDADDVYDEVVTTVVHEIAHHFGISDDRLDELGW
jgi:predicted Zn-dependent protease with MMP-like domain